MHLLNERFDKVVCINLIDRKDKRDKLERSFEQIGLNVEWFNAVKYEFLPNLVEAMNVSGKAHFNKLQPYEIGAALSHYHVLKQALSEGAKNIFVFEDDALFHKDFNAKLEKYWSNLPSDWDMISLYSFMYSLAPQNIRISNRWIKSYKSWSLLAYGMKEAVMKDYINRQNSFFTIADMVTFQMQETTKFNMYTATPALCVPSTTLRSDIRTQMNYKDSPTITNIGYSNDNYE